MLRYHAHAFPYDSAAAMRRYRAVMALNRAYWLAFFRARTA